MGKAVIERLQGADHVKLPVKATPGSACFDIHAAEDTELVAGRVTMVRTGLKMRAPKGTFIEVRPRSGLSSKGVVMVNAPGTIDRDYAEEVKILLTLLVGSTYQIKAGDRIAQMRIVRETPAEIGWGRVRPMGKRSGGFGSTGR